MTDLHDDFEQAFRRVPAEPVLQELAKQVVDRLEQWKADGLVIRLSTAIMLAREYGVPLDYVFAERERRVRDGQPFGKGTAVELDREVVTLPHADDAMFTCPGCGEAMLAWQRDAHACKAVR